MDRSATAGLELIALSFSLSCSFGSSGLAPSPRSCGWHGGKGTHRGPLSRGLAVGERPEDFSGLLIGKAAGGGLNWTQQSPQRPGPFITFPFFVLTRCRGPDHSLCRPSRQLSHSWLLGGQDLVGQSPTVLTALDLERGCGHTWATVH